MPQNTSQFLSSIKSQRALNLSQENIPLHEQYLGENHPSIAHLLMPIGDLYKGDVDDERKLQSLEKALDILQKHFHCEYAAIASCRIMITE